MRVGKDPSKDRIVGDVRGTEMCPTQQPPPWWELPLDEARSEHLFSVCEMALIAVSLVKGLKRSQVGKRFENEREREAF